MKYTCKGHPLHGQLMLYDWQITIIHYRVLLIYGSNLVKRILEWKVLDTRCSDSKSNSIDKHCAMLTTS